MAFIEERMKLLVSQIQGRDAQVMMDFDQRVQWGLGDGWDLPESELSVLENLNYWNDLLITGFHISRGQVPDRTPKMSSGAGGQFLPGSLLVIRGTGESQHYQIKWRCDGMGQDCKCHCESRTCRNVKSLKTKWRRKSGAWLAFRDDYPHHQPSHVGAGLSWHPWPSPPTRHLLWGRKWWFPGVIRSSQEAETTAEFIDCVSSWVPGAEAFFTSLVYNMVGVIPHPFILQGSSKALRNEAGNVGLGWVRLSYCGSYWLKSGSNSIRAWILFYSGSERKQHFLKL